MKINIPQEKGFIYLTNRKIKQKNEFEITKKLKKGEQMRKILNKIKINAVGVGVPDDPKEKYKFANKPTSNNQTSNIKHPTSNSAITLIALIITIIVLLILAGVTLSMVMGESGIFSKANNASEQTKISNAKEIIRMQVLENELNKKTKDANTKSDEDLQVNVETKLTEEGYKVEEGKIKIGDTEINIAEEIANASSGETNKITIADGDNTQGTEPKTIDGKKATYINPKIPAGFKAVDNSIDSTIDSNENWTNGEGYKYGLVIQDKEGNQFVWIAVDGTNVKLDRYQFQDSLNYKGESYTKYSETKDEAWAQKVETYGGYYIGRYEAKYENNKCVVKQGNVPTVNVTRDTARGYAQKMKNDYGYGVTTDLLNSYMWDTALKYIDYYTNSSFSTTTGLGNAGGKNSSAVASGSYSDDIKCNIADMSGNVVEWTTEYYSSGSPCVSRGGRYTSSYAACRRDFYNARNSYSYTGFRCALYW